MNRTERGGKLLGPVLAGFFIMGFCDLVAPITGRIGDEFPAGQQGAVSFLPTMVFLWFLVLSTPVAALMNRWGRKATALVGYGFTIAGMLVPYAAGAGCSLVWYFVGFGLLGIGNTFVQVAVNPLLATIVPGERMTSYLTVGQIFRNTSLLLLAPLVTGLVAWTGSWRLLLPIYAGLTVLGGVWLQMTAIPEPPRRAHTAGFGECFRLLKNPRVLISTAGVACFIAGDVGIGFLVVDPHHDGILRLPHRRDTGRSVAVDALLRREIPGLEHGRSLAAGPGAGLRAERSGNLYGNRSVGIRHGVRLRHVLCRGDKGRSGTGQRGGGTDDSGHLRRSRIGSGLRGGDPCDGRSAHGNALRGGVPGLHALGCTPAATKMNIIKTYMRKLGLTLLLVCAAWGASAQRPRTMVEWGVIGGINVPDYTTNMDATDIRNKMGWQAGIVTAVKFGAVAVEPQILYVRQGLRIRPEGGEELNLKSNSIDVPVLASFRLLNPLRIYAGPVFTVMNDCKQKSGGDLLDFGRIRPSLSYTVGAGVVLLRHLLIDVRYNGQFRSKHDVVLPDGRQLDKLRTYNVALSVGYIF